MAHAEQVQVRELIATVGHPRVGAMRLAGLPIKLNETPGAVTRPPPLLGEHTAEILEALRYSPQRIADLAGAGIVEIAAAASSK
jgi:crotonobetainyl-CoA:carnitine CoA-transferase CaiB-like acyl-CoA transferase